MLHVRGTRHGDEGVWGHRVHPEGIDSGRLKDRYLAFKMGENGGHLKGAVSRGMSGNLDTL